MPDKNPNKLVEHFFRHEAGNLVAALSRFFGLRHFDLVEDMVQAALIEALRSWKTQGIPNQPAAWVRRVAKNKVIDSLRRDATFRRKAAEFAVVDEATQSESLDHFLEEGQLQDNLLRMIFACCHPALPIESQIPLTLKTVCGFREPEIASGLLLTVGTVRKRIYRAKQSIIEHRISMDLPHGERLAERLESVHNVLYLMFNEGYCSSGENEAIRLDVCEEAARLCHLLTESPGFDSSTTKALLALMLFHACRFQSRVDHEGALVLLEDQNRKLWDRRLMGRAFEFLCQAMEGGKSSSYHIEAAIAMYHCKAERFADTNWDAIVKLYNRLIAQRPWPIYRLNHAVAISQRDGPQAALALLKEICDEPKLQAYHLLDAAFGECYRQMGEFPTARDYFQRAISKAHAPHDKQILQKRLANCQ